jgi:hypothetical protein
MFIKRKQPWKDGFKLIDFTFILYFKSRINFKLNVMFNYE